MEGGREISCCQEVNAANNKACTYVCGSLRGKEKGRKKLEKPKQR